jgi:hypothetical protein
MIRNHYYKPLKGYNMAFHQCNLILFDLVVRDTHIENVSLRPDEREVRLAGTYRHSFGEFTDGAIRFIYRVNPNHTDKFGNESVFMMKMTHRLGI